jgi:hypothetical protein
MRNRFAAVVLLILAGIIPAAAQTRPVTIDDVLSLKAVGSPAVSPDGSQVIYTVRARETERDRQESHWPPDGAFIAWTSEPMTAKPIGDGTYPSYIGNNHLIAREID